MCPGCGGFSLCHKRYYFRCRGSAKLSRSHTWTNGGTFPRFGICFRTRIVAGEHRQNGSKTFPLPKQSFRDARNPVRRFILDTSFISSLHLADRAVYGLHIWRRPYSHRPVNCQMAKPVKLLAPDFYTTFTIFTLSWHFTTNFTGRINVLSLETRNFWIYVAYEFSRKS